MGRKQRVVAALVAAILGGSGSLRAKPSPYPVPSLLKSYTVPVTNDGKITTAPKFNPHLGQLRGVSAKLSGPMHWTVTFEPLSKAVGSYSFTTYTPTFVAGTNVWFSLTAKGSGTWQTGVAVQPATGTVAGERSAEGTGIVGVFSGVGTIRLAISPDKPQFTPQPSPAYTVDIPATTLTGTITYSYLPIILPKKPITPP